ncbi:hemerythrin domain-containing protein [Streptomyces sp. NPDC015130]|uniref:hemerythrin domain-containing protein n=1 Tax=Streptomyces sp. NPDC015130 TaxID=3364940 RepID=UPI0036FAD2C2
MDAIVLLREDHKTVEKLFKAFEKTEDEDTAERRRIVDEVIEELTVHAWIEEQYSYPAVRETAPNIKDHVPESVEEHHAVVWTLSELKAMDASDDRFKAKTTVSMGQVRHHVEEEEQDRFPDVRKAMGRNRLQELCAQLEDAKEQAPRDRLKVPSAASK